LENVVVCGGYRHDVWNVHIDVTIVGGNFKEISALIHSRLWRNNLNNFLLNFLLAMLLLLAFFVASSFDYFLGIRGHPSSMTQSNVLKTLFIAFGVFNDASTFLSSPSSCVSFYVLILVDY
jgi:hypothetical protein